MTGASGARPRPRQLLLLRVGGRRLRLLPHEVDDELVALLPVVVGVDGRGGRHWIGADDARRLAAARRHAHRGAAGASGPFIGGHWVGAGSLARRHGARAESGAEHAAASTTGALAQGCRGNVAQRTPAVAVGPGRAAA